MLNISSDSRSSCASTRRARRYKARVALADKQLVSLDDPEVTSSLDAANVGAQCVLIATQQADGTLAVNAIVHSSSVLSAALAAYYGKHKDVIAADVANETNAQSEADKLQQQIDLVAEAAMAA